MEGDLTEAFLPYEFGGGLYLEGLIHGGSYFRNLTVLNAAWRNEISLRLNKENFVGETSSLTKTSTVKNILSTLNAKQRQERENFFIKAIHI